MITSSASVPSGIAFAAPLQPTAIHLDVTSSPDLIEVRAAGVAGVGLLSARAVAQLPIAVGAAVIEPRGGAYHGEQRSEDRGVMSPFAAPPSFAAAAGRDREIIAGQGVSAIAAGAAIGFVSAATAAAWAGAAPAPGMCWYYTDPSRTQGFWDYCQ